MHELILVRHGFPDHMLLDMTGGWTPSHLTELGRRQAAMTGRCLAQMLADEDFDLYSSDLPRAAETAEIIGLALNKTPVCVAELREQSLGLANNVNSRRARELALNPVTGPVVDRIFFPQAETWRHMMNRVFDFLDRLDEQGKQTVLLVSHAGAGTAVIFWWLQLPADYWPGMQFELDLCSITHMRMGEFAGRRIVRLNDVRHLGDLRA